jgi:SP family general alpha glucoside:H+ symporter-like MFS transporter
LPTITRHFYEQAGLPANNAYKMIDGPGGLHFACTIASVFLTGHAGRRRIFIVGCGIMSIAVMIIDFMTLPK